MITFTEDTQDITEEDLEPNQLGFYFDEPEDEAIFNELVAALKSAQIKFDMSTNGETEETIITYDENQEDAVYNILKGLGIDTGSLSDDDWEDDYEDWEEEDEEDEDDED